jgi:ATP-dependent exoDNAse (exonuclease V) alpha subunit
MAIFHLTTKIVSRGSGQSAVAKAAYNSREKILQERTGEISDYRRKGRPLFSGIFTPDDAPEWMHDRSKLWNAVESTEKRKDSQLAREVEISLPHELTDEQREWLVKDFVREQFTRKGMVADVNIHHPSREGDERNHHAHILLTMRRVNGEGFGEKVREWNSAGQLERWREAWEHTANRHLDRHGHEERVDRRSLEAQGVDREPTTHRGPFVDAIERKGIKTDRARNQGHNAEIVELKAELGDVEKERRALEKGIFRDKNISGPVNPTQTATSIVATGGKAVGVVAGVADKLVDLIDGLLDIAVGGPPRKITAAEYLESVEARREHNAQKAAAAKREKAIDTMERDRLEGRQYTQTDLYSLSREDLEALKAHGVDDGVRLLAEALFREREKTLKRDLDRDRERER